MKTFLILTDLDSTFEEYEENSNDFNCFQKFIGDFEKVFNVEIKIHFISGTNNLDLTKRFNFFKNKYPDIYKKIDYAFISGGIKFDKNFGQIGICETDKEIYTKADAVQHIIKDYGKFSLAGACYMGDDTTDISAFRTIKYYRSQLLLGAYALAPRSRRAFEQIKKHIDFYSDKPRILGCVDNLVKMSKEISKTIALENDISEKTP